MVFLSLSTFVATPPEEVYQYVTAYGPDVPADETAFQAKYSKVLSREDNVYVTQEEERKYEGEEPEKFTWRCTFEYPSLRTMQALDSGWADRTDRFRPEGGGTRWSIRWNTRTGGVKGLAHYLTFLLLRRRQLRGAIAVPVKAHFEGR